MAIPAEKVRYSFADCLTWDESVRAEIIDGEMYLMSPPSRIHQKISMSLATQLHNYLQGKTCEVYAAPFGVRLFEKEADAPEDVDTLVEPDICVVCDPGKLDEHGCKGTPDLVIEILSPSTQRHDRIIKFNLYQQAGVREYWIVDPRNKEVQSFVLVSGRYEAREFASAQDSIKVDILEDCWIDLTQVFSG